MSWKATAFVKDLVKGIKPAEKLLLFVLADYHNTAQKIAWPSMELLARESLMSERNARRVLANLEAKGYVRRIYPTDHKKTIYYEIPALDWADNLSSQKADKKRGKGGPSGYRNKEERVEPVLLGNCERHPDSGLTNHGRCYGCYAEEHSQKGMVAQ